MIEPKGTIDERQARWSILSLSVRHALWNGYCFVLGEVGHILGTGGLWILGRVQNFRGCEEGIFGMRLSLGQDGLYYFVFGCFP